MEQNYEAQVYDKKLTIDGFLYLRSKSKKDKTYWDCKRLRLKECKARAITGEFASGDIMVLKGPRESPHSHPPNREECEVENFLHRYNNIIPLTTNIKNTNKKIIGSSEKLKTTLNSPLLKFCAQKCLT